MEAIEFVLKYVSFLEEISQVIKPELQPFIDELRQKDPTDLIRPEVYFESETSARGFVWSMFMRNVKTVKHFSSNKV